MDNSILSSTVSSQSRLARIVANVVDTQQKILEGYATINSSLAALNLEHQSAMANLREDLRRIDDRAERQINGMRVAHSHEVGNLLDIIKTLLARGNDNGSSSRPAQQASYAAASSPAKVYKGADPHMAHMFLQQQLPMHQQAQNALQQLSLDGQQFTSWRSPQTQQSTVLSKPNTSVAPKLSTALFSPLDNIPSYDSSTKDKEKKIVTTVPVIVNSVAFGPVSKEVQLSTAIPTIQNDETASKRELNLQSCLINPTTEPSFGFFAAKEESFKSEKPAFSCRSHNDSVSMVKVSIPSLSVSVGSTATVQVTVPPLSNAPLFRLAQNKDEDADKLSLRNSSFDGDSTVVSSRTLVPHATLQMFGKSSPKNDFALGGSKNNGATPKTVFGNEFSSGQSYASLSKAANNTFEADAAGKANTLLSALPASKILSASNGSYVKEGDDYEPDVDFKPLIPLPDLVQVKSGEEHELVVFQARAKLFRFEPETKENKERGLGDIKILKNPVTSKYRAVMRREHTFQLCANFNILPAIKIAPKPQAANVYQFCCMDFAEDDTGTQEVFAIKFKTEQLAKEFYGHFSTAQKQFRM